MGIELALWLQRRIVGYLELEGRQEGELAGGCRRKLLLVLTKEKEWRVKMSPLNEGRK